LDFFAALVPKQESSIFFLSSISVSLQ